MGSYIHHSLVSDIHKDVAHRFTYVHVERSPTKAFTATLGPALSKGTNFTNILCSLINICNIIEPYFCVRTLLRRWAYRLIFFFSQI